MRLIRSGTFVCLIALKAGLLSAQAIPESLPGEFGRNLHERCVLVVPMTGAGTYADPKRPLIPGSDKGELKKAMLGWSFTPSDDGRFALLEIKAKDTSVCRAAEADARVVKFFQKGKHKPDDIERELKVFRKSFSIRPDKAGAKLP